MTPQDIVDSIVHTMRNTQDWSADTLDIIAMYLIDEGYVIHEPDDSKPILAGCQCDTCIL